MALMFASMIPIYGRTLEVAWILFLVYAFGRLLLPGSR